MSVPEDGLAAFDAEVARRGGTVERLADRETLLAVTDPAGTTRRVKLKTKARGDWQAQKSDATPRLSGKGIDLWVLVDVRRPPSEAVIVEAEWMRQDIEREVGLWLAADPARDATANNHHKVTDARVGQWRSRWDLLGLNDTNPTPTSHFAAPDRPVTDETLGAWVFKCNPKVYDLPAQIADGERFIDSWSVAGNNYRSVMIGSGHKAILWMSGPETGSAPRGIWGIGWTTGTMFDASTLGSGYWVDQEQAAAVESMVPTAIQILDQADRLEAHELRAVPALQDLEVFTSPQQSNPSWVSKDQLAALEKLLPSWPKPDAVPTTPISVGGKGAGFGDAETNRRVEMAAMTAVATYLETQWDAQVDDVSAQNLGWDLTATLPRGEQWHIEVKGVRGTRPVVLLTVNECRAASVDDSWELAVVTEALSDNPVVRIYEADQMLNNSQPFVLRADLSGEEGWGG